MKIDEARAYLERELGQGEHWELGYAYWSRGKAQVFTVWCDNQWNVIQHAAGPDLRRDTTKLRDEALERINGERDE